MSLIKKPSELPVVSVVKGLIYGQPGVGKSTLALSAPNPIMFDFDGGMRRVAIAHQKDSVQITNYKEMIDVINSGEIDSYSTIVIDTLGKLVDSLSASINPKFMHPNGSPTLQGWGQIKIDFQALLKLLHSKNKSVIFVAHEAEEKEGESVKKRPDCSGSPRKDIVKELDFMGYMSIIGGKRCIDFSPQDSYYAKNSLGITSFIEVLPIKTNNDFLEKNIFTRITELQVQQSEMRAEYDTIKSNIDNAIFDIWDIENLNKYYSEQYNKCKNISSIHIYEKTKLFEKSKELKANFDPKTKSFVI
jgi:phage nucleotide-binding protein